MACAVAPSHRYMWVFTQHLAGVQPELGEGRYLPKLNGAVKFLPRYTCVYNFSAFLVFPGTGPVYQSCSPSPALLSQLSSALIREKINHGLQTLWAQKERRKFDKRVETSRKLTFILKLFIARIHYIKDIDVITRITFSLCIILS